MLKVITGIALLLCIALIGYRRTFTSFSLPAGARLIFLTGTEFILVGAALGSGMIGLLDSATISSLTPIFCLGLGFIGLIFGIQFEYDKIKLFPDRYILIALIQAVVTVAVVFFPFYFILAYLFDGDRQPILFASLVLAITAGCTAQTSLALLSRESYMAGSKLMELLRFISSFDALLGLTYFGFILCLMHAFSPFGFERGIGFQWLAVSLAMGVVMGFILHLLTQVNCSDKELLIFVFGLIVFSGGISLYFRLSPLFINMVIGITAANLPGSKERIFNLLARMEKPIYIIFLILAGAIWHLGSPWAIMLSIIYVALRCAGKILGGFLASGTVPKQSRPSPWLGLGLISQGGIVIAMVMSYYQLSGSIVTDVVVTIVLVSVILNELAGPSLAGNLLKRAAGANNE